MATAKKERLDLKLEADEKRLFARAAETASMSLSAFIRTAALAQADEVLARETRLRMSARDYDAFARAMENPPPFNARLMRALQRSDEEVREPAEATDSTAHAG